MREFKARFLGCVSRKADGVACGLRLASRADWFGTPPLLRQWRDRAACSAATASHTVRLGVRFHGEPQKHAASFP